MHIDYSDMYAVVHHSPILQVQTVTYYIFMHAYLLLHESASVHSALSVQQFLADNGMTDIPQNLYSPDLPHYDFIFP
jgi:hypothetical protein